jgi:hypothetical protein
MALKAKAVKNVEQPASPKQTLQSEDMILLQENLTTLTQTLATLSTTLEAHVQKTANIASHVVAMEEILSEIISVTGISLADVNSRIRKRIITGGADTGAADLAIDCAATIATRRLRL